MIAFLDGTVVVRDDPAIVINVNGVGYQVFAAKNVLSKITVGSSLKLHIHTHVREDLLELYGFETREDLKLFEYLISVSGVGCKTALGVFSVGGRNEIIGAIMKGDVGFFTTVPRLGKKNAQKLIIELKAKLGSQEDLDLSSDGEEDNDVVLALKTFGYTPREAQEAFRAVADKAPTTSERVRLALKYLGK